MTINFAKPKKMSSTNFVENLKDPPPRHNGHSFQGVARNQPVNNVRKSQLNIEKFINEININKR